MLDSFLPIFIVLGSLVLLLYYLLYRRGLLSPLWTEFAQRPALSKAWSTSVYITAASFLLLSILVALEEDVNYNRFVPAYGLFLASACVWSLLHLGWNDPWPPLESLCLAVTAAASMYMYWIASVGSSTALQIFSVPIVVHHIFWDFIVSRTSLSCSCTVHC